MEKLILFNLGNKPHGLDVTAVQEILAQVTTRKVPHAAAYLQGLFDFRGKIIPLLDLRVLLSLADTSERCHVIVVNHQEVSLGLTVDKVLAVITDQEQVKYKRKRSKPNSFIRCFAEYKGQEVAILDLAQLTALIGEEETTHVN